MRDLISAGLGLTACLVIGDKPFSIVLAAVLIAVALAVQGRGNRGTESHTT